MRSGNPWTVLDSHRTVIASCMTSRSQTAFLIAAVLPALVACTSSDKGGDVGTDDTGPGSESFTIDAALSDVIPTVATVTWDWKPVDSAWVEWGRDGTVEHRVAVHIDDGVPQPMPIIGMKPQTTYDLRVVATASDGTQGSSDAVQVTTGNVPSTLPAIEIENPGAATPGFFVTSAMAQAAAVIIDSDGDYVWWYIPDGLDLMGRVRLSVDGTSMYMADINLLAESDHPLIKVSLDGTVEERIDTPLRHHDFVEHADGTLAWLAANPETVDGVQVKGDRIIELAPDGVTTTPVYSVVDHHDPGAGIEAGGGPGGPTTRDWPHANSLSIVDDGDSYIVSFLYMGGIAKVDRATGAEDWFLGGPEGTLDVDGDPDFRFDSQHGVDYLGDHVLVFENGASSTTSRVQELSLDPDAGTAQQVWTYTPDPELSSPVFGDVHRHDSGNTLVTFSYNGQVQELDADGNLVWRMSTSLGGAINYLTWVETLQAE